MWSLPSVISVSAEAKHHSQVVGAPSDLVGTKTFLDTLSQIKIILKLGTLHCIV